GGGGCIVSRAASKGGASGRAWTWARIRAGFPESQTIATNARADFNKDLQGIAKTSGVILIRAQTQAAHIFYTHMAEFQIKNRAERLSTQSSQRAQRKPSAKTK